MVGKFGLNHRIKILPSTLRLPPADMSQLFKLVTPPRNPFETGTPKAWEKIEIRLGSALPADYRTFIDCYGTGSFDDIISVV